MSADHIRTRLTELAATAARTTEACLPEIERAVALVRETVAAIALTTDTSLLTAAGNDFGFDHIFERQVQALTRAGDLLMIHSTSGNSPNVLLAAQAARAKGAKVVALSSRDGGKLRALADVNIVIPTDRTDRAQELHLHIQHLICELVEQDIHD